MFFKTLNCLIFSFIYNSLVSFKFNSNANIYIVAINNFTLQDLPVFEFYGGRPGIALSRKVAWNEADQ